MTGGAGAGRSTRFWSMIREPSCIGRLTEGATGCAIAVWEKAASTKGIARNTGFMRKNSKDAEKSGTALTAATTCCCKDRKSVEYGKSVSVRVDLGCRRILTKKKEE